jgi:hypothetical protein
MTLILSTGCAAGDWNTGAAAGGNWDSGAGAGGDGFTSQDARSGGDGFGATDGDATGKGASAGVEGACRNCGQGQPTKTIGRMKDIADYHFTEGHFARDCPEPRKYGGGACFNCGEEGHGKAECTNPRVARAFDGECRLCSQKDKHPSPRVDVLC